MTSDDVAGLNDPPEDHTGVATTSVASVQPEGYVVEEQVEYSYEHVEEPPKPVGDVYPGYTRDVSV